MYVWWILLFNNPKLNQKLRNNSIPENNHLAKADIQLLLQLDIALTVAKI